MKRLIAVWGLAWAAMFTMMLLALADDNKPSGPDPKLHRETVDRAMQYLAKQQSQNGALSAQAGIGPTALATLGRMPLSMTPRFLRPSTSPIFTVEMRVSGFLKSSSRPGTSLM